jgi:hypothetical protein
LRDGRCPVPDAAWTRAGRLLPDVAARMASICTSIAFTCVLQGAADIGLTSASSRMMRGYFHCRRTASTTTKFQAHMGTGNRSSD